MSEDGADKPSGGRGAHPLKYSRKLPTEALTGLATELAGESSAKLCDGAGVGVAGAPGVSAGRCISAGDAHAARAPAGPLVDLPRFVRGARKLR